MRAHCILCPVDFSDPSRRALHYAAALASREGAVLHVLYVVPAAIPLPVPILMLAARPAVGDVQAGAAEALDAFVARAALPRRPITIVRDGPPVDAILACAAELAADLIVLGSHGRDGLGHLLFGSTAERVLHKAPCPTLVVPLHAEEPASADGVRFTRLVCAVDFSPASTRALGLALSMAQDHGAELTVLHVVEAVAEDELDDALPAAVRARVDALTRTARRTAARRGAARRPCPVPDPRGGALRTGGARDSARSRGARRRPHRARGARPSRARPARDRLDHARGGVPRHLPGAHDAPVRRNDSGVFSDPETTPESSPDPESSYGSGVPSAAVPAAQTMPPAVRVHRALDDDVGSVAFDQRPEVLRDQVRELAHGDAHAAVGRERHRGHDPRREAAVRQRRQRRGPGDAGRVGDQDIRIGLTCRSRRTRLPAPTGGWRSPSTRGQVSLLPLAVARPPHRSLDDDAVPPSSGLDDRGDGRIEQARILAVDRDREAALGGDVVFAARAAGRSAAGR